MRLTARYSLDEVAAQLSDTRPSLKHLDLSSGDVTKHWVSARLRELRKEIEETASD